MLVPQNEDAAHLSSFIVIGSKFLIGFSQSCSQHETSNLHHQLKPKIEVIHSGLLSASLREGSSADQNAALRNGPRLRAE
jgi:hypothetical protein